MPRIKDKRHVPATPKAYTFAESGHRIHWNSAHHPWNTFYSQVTAYAERNGFAVPSEEQVEAQICKQIPRAWCGDGGVIAPAPPRLTPETGGCKSCGGRR